VPLVKGMQEQQKIIEAQNKRIDDMQQKLEILLREVHELKEKAKK
jgi:hypothetical protein